MCSVSMVCTVNMVSGWPFASLPKTHMLLLTAAVSRLICVFCSEYREQGKERWFSHNNEVCCVHVLGTQSCFVMVVVTVMGDSGAGNICL